MSRQNKDTPSQDKPVTQANRDLGKQIHTDQLIALQRQIDQCQQQRRQLIQSRNYAIIVAVLASLIALYQSLIAPPVDCTGQQQVVVARQLAAYKKQLANQKCIEDTIKHTTIIDSEQTISDDVRQTISRIENKLHGNDSPTIDGNGQDKKTSSVLDRLNSPYPGSITLNSDDRQAISRTLYLWAIAWELKDLTTYFSYYSTNFEPQDAASSIQEWKALRSYRIGEPSSIKITLHDISVKFLDKNSATASFNQHYKTPKYSDKTHKLMELAREDGQWLILRENSFTTDVDLKHE